MVGALAYIGGCNCLRLLHILLLCVYRVPKIALRALLHCLGN